MTLRSSEVKNFSWRIGTILKSFLVSSASCLFVSSTFSQTNTESAQNRSEDNLLNFQNLQAHHLLLEVIDHDEEEYSIFLPLGKRDWIEFLVQYQSIFFHNRLQFLQKEQPEVGLRGLALAFGRLAEARTFNFNAQSSNCISEVSYSLSSSSLLLKSVTNLFKPWEILTHEWELSLFTDSILISTPFLPCR